MKIRLWP